MKYPFVLASAAALAAFSVPAQAQDEEAVAELSADDEASADADFSDLEDDDFTFDTIEEALGETFEQELTDAFSVFGEMFAADLLTPEQEALLPLAKRMTEKVFPEGSFAVIMEESMAPMMTAIMSAGEGDARTELAALTGIEQEELEALDDAVVDEALGVLDPHLQARGDRLGEIVVSMIGELFDAIEPAYREAIARAFTTRFSGDEMEELLVFFESPIGAKFAQQSFLIQYDPHMMSMMESMGPAMAEIFPKMMTDVLEMTMEFPEGRVYSELSAAERARLSQLLGKGEAELEALAPEREELDDEEVEGVI